MICLLALVALAETSPLLGRWSATTKGGNGEQMKVTFEFKQAGSGLTGQVITENGDVAPIDSISIEGNQFKFKINVDEGAYTVTGTVKGDEVTGSFTAPRGNTGAFTAKRS